MKLLAVFFAMTSLLFSAVTAQSPKPPPEITPTPSAAPKPMPSPVNPGTPVPSPPPARAQAPAPSPASPREIVDSLSDADVQEIIGILKANYLNPDALSDAQLSRATVQGLIERLTPGATVNAESSSANAAAENLHSEVLYDRIVYVRMGALASNRLAALDEALKQAADRALKSVILDLRATPQTSDFEMAAEVIKRFSPKGQELFTIQKQRAKKDRIFTSNQDQKFQGVLVVLVDNETSGAAEVIAAVLRESAKALIVGENTAGQAVEFAEMPLRSGKILRVAISEAVLPGKGALYPRGVKPDIIVPMRDEARRELFSKMAEGSVMATIAETERTRLNEAALVAGVNPEIDAIQAAQRDRGEKPKAPVRDVQLQRAVDLITTIGIYEKTGAK